MTQRYLVTGGAGFIGSHVTDRLLGLGHEVTVIDNFCTGKRDNLSAVLEEGGHDAARLRVVEASITDPVAVAEAFDGVSGCVHLAALPPVVRSVEAPVESHESNVTGGIHASSLEIDSSVPQY